MTEFPQAKVRLLVPWLLGCSGVGCVAGAMVGWTELAAACGVAAFAALAGYVVLAQGPAGPRLRRPLLAAALILALVVAADGIWSAQMTPEFGWYTYGSVDDVTTVLDRLAEQSLVRQRWWSLGMLVASVCLALAVTALPYRRRPRLAVVTVVLSLLMLGVVVVDLVDLARSGIGAVGGAVLALLSALVALATAAIAGQRAGKAWLAAIGGGLLAVPLLISAGETALTADWPAADGTQIYVMESIYIASVEVPDESVIMSRLDPWSAFLAAAMLAGPVLVVVGCLRATRGQVAAPAAPPE